MACAVKVRVKVFEHLPELLAKLGRVLVSMHVGGVQHGRAHYLVFLSGDGQRALLVARVVSAVDELA